MSRILHHRTKINSFADQMSQLIWASLYRVIFNPHRDLSCVSTEHWTQADPSLIKHCSRIRAQKLSDSNNNNSMSDCNLQSGPWRVNNNNQQRFSMSDCNLGRDDLCRTTIWAMTIYAGLQSGPWRDSYSLYPVLYAGSTSSLGQDETVSTYLSLSCSLCRIYLKSGPWWDSFYLHLSLPTYTYIKS